MNPVDSDDFYPTADVLKCLRGAFTIAANEIGVADLWVDANEAYGKNLEKFEQCDQEDNASEVRK